MRKVTVSAYLTLDGVMSPVEWSAFLHFRNARHVLFACDTLLMGRDTYETFAASWPTRTAAADPPGEEWFVDRRNINCFVVTSGQTLRD